MARDPRLGIQGALIAPGITPQRPQAPSLEELGLATKIQAFVSGAEGVARGAAYLAAVQEESQRIQDSEDIIESRARGAGIPEQLRTVSVHNEVWSNEAAKALDTLDPSTIKRKPNEKDADVLHRWIGLNTPVGAPDVFKAALLEGGREKFARNAVREARLAQIKALDDLGANRRRTAYSETPEDHQKAIDAHKIVADRLGVSEDAQRAESRAGVQQAAEEGNVDQVEKMSKFLDPADAKRLKKRAIDVFQGQQFSAAHAQYAENIILGVDFTGIMADIDSRTDQKGERRDFSVEQGDRLKSYIRSVAQRHFSAQYWPDFWDGVSTPQGREASLREAHRQGILSPQEVNTWNRKTKEADKFVGEKITIEKFLSGEIKGVPGPELDEAKLALAGDYKYAIIAQGNDSGTEPIYIGSVPGKLPAFAQFQAELVEGGVLTDVSKQIARNMESTNPNAEKRLGDMTTATRDYLAYTPEQQSTIKSRAGQEARMRFSAIDNIIREGGNPVEQMPRIASYKIRDVTDEQAMSAILTKKHDPNLPPLEAPLTEANKVIKKMVPEIILDLTNKWYSAPKIDTIPPDMPNAFIEGSTDEYRTQLDVLGHDGAVVRGEKVGIFDSFGIAQPVPWGDRLMWVRDAPPTIKLVGDEFVMISDVGAFIENELKTRGGFTDKYIKEVLQKDYRIAFNQDKNKFWLLDKIDGKPKLYERDGVFPVFFSSGGLAIPKRKTPAPITHPRRFTDTAQDTQSSVQDLIDEWTR